MILKILKECHPSVNLLILKKLIKAYHQQIVNIRAYKHPKKRRLSLKINSFRGHNITGVQNFRKASALKWRFHHVKLVLSRAWFTSELKRNWTILRLKWISVSRRSRLRCKEINLCRGSDMGRLKKHKGVFMILLTRARRGSISVVVSTKSVL